MKKEMSIERSKKSQAVVTKEVKDFGVVDEDELDEMEDVEITMKYEEFYNAIEKDIVVKCKELLEKALNEVGFGPEQIDKVIMTGGSCKNPFIQEMLIERFGKEKVDTSQADFDLLVTKGAAIFANEIGNGIKTLEMGEISMHDIGVMLKDEEDPKKTVNHIVIKKETPLPLKKKPTITVTTSEDSMNELTFKITEAGEVKNTLIISDLPQLPSGCVEIELEFDVKDNGELVVTATQIEPKPPVKKDEHGKDMEDSKGNPIYEEPKKNEVKIMPDRRNIIQEKLNEEAERIDKLYNGKIKFWD